MEPPGPQLPARSLLTTIPSAARWGLAGAGLVLAVSSRGDASVLAVVLAALAWRPTAVLAVGAAFVASSWRWDASSLEALSGAQAVLGPAGGVGPPAAAAGSWLAAAAILLALAGAVERTGRVAPIDLARAAAAGAAVAAVVAGPALGGHIAVRAAVAVGAATASIGFGLLRAPRPRLDRVLSVVSVLVGAGAVASIATDAPAWPPSAELATVGEGAVLALAASALVVSAVGAFAARASRRDGDGALRRRRLYPAPGPRRPRQR
ncbi:MAG: hypothetical protein Q8K58_05955 [Acidimicrobiales bacterium]|nr:hypothetical protein [Acidimicrobiales bacterium]